MVPLAKNRTVIGNETDTVILTFRIDWANPPVKEANLKWFYSSNFDVIDPTVSNISQEITGLTNRTSVSMFTFSAYENNMISLTVLNIVQAVGDQRTGTDEGRYFLMATNVAGHHVDYIDLIVFGKSYRVKLSFRLGDFSFEVCKNL